MWPFSRKREHGIHDAVSEATDLAARRWAMFCDTSGTPANINLRDRVLFFATDFRREMVRRLPALRGAPEELVLLIIAQGIELSGLESRRMIELQLGITLPDRANAADE